MRNADAGRDNTPTAPVPWRTPRSTHVEVHGATLTGLAVALRLARVGHHVTITDAPSTDVSDWPAVAEPLPGTLSVRAAWMDLVRKSGRPFDAELARHHLTLTPAPPTHHVFTDGLELDLPDERGAQFHAISHTLGAGPAQRWADLLDAGDDLWQALRTLGLEEPRPERLTRDQRRSLWWRRTLDDLAAHLHEPHLGAIVRDLAPLAGATDAGAPALLLSRASADRRFGRWHLADATTGSPRPTTDLLPVFTERLRIRDVEVSQGPVAQVPPCDALVDCTPGPVPSRHVDAAWAPAIRHTERAAAPTDPPFTHTVTHTDAGLIVRWERRTDSSTVRTLEHDHTRRRRDPAFGLAPDSWRAWITRPATHTQDPPPDLPGNPAWRASASSPGGNEPWAQLLAGALVAYDVHAALTGEDIRPSNRAYHP